MSFRTGLPSKLTAQWFEPNEYDIANSMASLADPLGTMIACLFAPFIALKIPAHIIRANYYNPMELGESISSSFTLAHTLLKEALVYLPAETSNDDDATALRVTLLFDPTMGNNAYILK